MKTRLLPILGNLQRCWLAGLAVLFGLPALWARPT